MVDGDSPKSFVGLCFIRINLILAQEDLAMIMYLFIQRFVMMQVLLLQTIIIIYTLMVVDINLPRKLLRYSRFSINFPFDSLFSYYSRISPTRKPSQKPSLRPSATPTTVPTMKPSGKPTFYPTRKPSLKPSVKATVKATVRLRTTMKPTSNPAATPNPSMKSRSIPTSKPSKAVDRSSAPSSSRKPTVKPSPPGKSHTYIPTRKPTNKHMIVNNPSDADASNPESESARDDSQSSNHDKGSEQIIVACSVSLGALVTVGLFVWFSKKVFENNGNYVQVSRKEERWGNIEEIPEVL